MQNRAVIRKGGPLIQISADGQNPLPRAIMEELEDPLYYTHLFFEYGQTHNNGGSEEIVRDEPRRQFQYDENGLLVTQKGFLSRLTGILSRLGYNVELFDADAPKSPKIYTPQFDRIFEGFDIRPQQDVCVAQIDMHDGGIIDAITAFGKMYVIAMVCTAYPKAKIDVVTKRGEVAENLKRLISKYVPSVGRVGGGKRKQGRVTVYTARSLHHADFDADIVLADEVHELMTDNIAKELARYHSARMYGFTASKETRMDNAHYRLEGLFGPTIFEMDYQTGVNLGLVVPMLVQWLDIKSDLNPVKGVDSLVAQKRWGLWRNDQRNQIIAAAANSFVQDGMQTLILVDTVDHLLHLRKQLPDFAVCCGENATAVTDADKRDMYIRHGLLRPDEILMTAKLRERTRYMFEQRELMGVIATGVWAVGVSFDSLNVLFRADAADSETANIQLPGRVCRTDTVTGKECGILIDCMDCWDKKFLNRSYNRRRAYGKRGWTQYLGNGAVWNPPAGRGGRGSR